MYLGQGLYVTAMGMGLVFLSLAILLFAMMALDRIFPGRADAADQAPQPAAEQVTQSAEPQAAAPAQPPVPPGEFEAAVSGRRYTLALGGQSDGSRQVSVDGTTHSVRVDASPSGGIVIDGRTYHAQVLEVQPGRVRVLVEGSTFEVEMPEAPTPAASAPANGTADVEGESVLAPLPGKVLRIVVAPGARVERGQELCVLEAMKMENSIRAHRQGVVREVRATAGQSVAAGEPLIILGGTQ